ncbi:SRP72 Rna-binding domain-containing protein [Cardiosporidium cionae]|uniref:Signal recognition particle subunit SRP72 n=1 Tax=Cardiosporidium cionae TaxID=476202 RepID=A0ABQ7JDK7_9APIC|nr:SRP72 Rna-binding domain-containing protein [Cardiosporidium cionae]|eukprot:KAF8821725.1 SRP72 Rna-binding domain-containing protein [Cardiosporidium cionae]
MQILRLSPFEMDAIRCKVYCLLQMEKWSLAYNVMQSYRRNGKFWPKVEKILAFEQSYCLYRKNRLPEAMAVLNKYKEFVSHPESEKYEDEKSSINLSYDDKFILLEAQLFSRLSAYEKARSIYGDLLKEDSGNVLLKLNHMAANISAKEMIDIPLSLREVKEEAKESYEWMFNVACYLVECHRLGEALQCLSEAEVLCKNDLQTENKSLTVSALDSHGEMAYFKVQKGYILQRLNQWDAAKELYLDITQSNSTGDISEVDISVLAVATNNYHLLRSSASEASLASLLQEIQTNSVDSFKGKLPRKQAMHLAINKCLSLLREKRFEHCKTALNSTVAEFGKDEKPLLFLNIALQIAQQKFKKAHRLVDHYYTEHPEDSLCILAKAYLFLSTQKYDQAAALLISLPDVAFLHPDFLRCVIETQEMCTDASSSVEKTLQRVDYLFQKHHKHHHSMEPSHIGAFLTVLSNSCWRLHFWEKVSFYSQQFLQFVDGLDLHVLTQLVFSASFHNLPLAEAYCARLRSFLPPSYALTDPEDILQLDWQAMIFNAKNRTGFSFKETSEKKIKKKKTRKQHRYPASFDPQKPGPPPDPERWLPKYKRASYKKKQRKRKDMIRGTTQGSIPTAAEASALRRGAPSTAHVSVSHDSHKGKKAFRYLAVLVVTTLLEMLMSNTFPFLHRTTKWTPLRYCFFSS